MTFSNTLYQYSLKKKKKRRRGKGMRGEREKRGRPLASIPSTISRLDSSEKEGGDERGRFTNERKGEKRWMIDVPVSRALLSLVFPNYRKEGGREKRKTNEKRGRGRGGVIRPPHQLPMEDFQITILPKKKRGKEENHQGKKGAPRLCLLTV